MTAVQRLMRRARLTVNKRVPVKKWVARLSEVVYESCGRATREGKQTLIVVIGAVTNATGVAPRLQATG